MSVCVTCYVVCTDLSFGTSTQRIQQEFRMEAATLHVCQTMNDNVSLNIGLHGRGNFTTIDLSIGLIPVCRLDSPNGVFPPVL